MTGLSHYVSNSNVFPYARVAVNDDKIQWIISLQHQHPDAHCHDRPGFQVRQHHWQPPAEDVKLGVHPTAGGLLGDDLGTGHHETHAGVVVVHDVEFDAAIDEVEGAGGVAALWVADEDVGGVELLAVGDRNFR